MSRSGTAQGGKSLCAGAVVRCNFLRLLEAKQDVGTVERARRQIAIQPIDNGLGDLEIDNQLEFCRRLYGKVGGLLRFKDAVKSRITNFH